MSQFEGVSLRSSVHSLRLCVKKAVFNAETAEELAILDTTCQFDRKNQIEVPFMLF